MSIWVSVYCRKKVGAVRPARLAAEIKARLANFSEVYGDEAPDEALARLSVVIYKRPGGAALLQLNYTKEPFPVVIDRVTRPDDVSGHAREYVEEYLSGRRGKQVSAVREHLTHAAEVINFCLKQAHHDGMGLPLTLAAAAWFADKGDGLVHEDYHGWLRLTEDGTFALILPDSQ
jgi:hypothetical protein